MQPAGVITKHSSTLPDNLKPFVERIWAWTGGDASTGPILMPGTGADLIFHLNQPFRVIRPDGSSSIPPKAHLTCIRSTSCKLQANPSFDFVSVRFRSSALRHFSAIDPAAFLDRFPPASEALGNEVDDLPDKLAALPSFDARAVLLTRFLTGKFNGRYAASECADKAVDALYYSRGSIRVIANNMGYGERQFERLVSGATGLTPKNFQRVARLHHTMRKLFLERKTDYLDAALAEGYYDQSHFIHEVRELSGFSPREILTPQAFMSHFYNTSQTDCGKMSPCTAIRQKNQ